MDLEVNAQTRLKALKKESGVAERKKFGVVKISPSWIFF